MCGVEDEVCVGWRMRCVGVEDEDEGVCEVEDEGVGWMMRVCEVEDDSVGREWK